MDTSHYSNNNINNDEKVSSKGNNNPDSGFINTLRYGMLAVRLLPRSSISSKYFYIMVFYTVVNIFY